MTRAQVRTSAECAGFTPALARHAMRAASRAASAAPRSGAGLVSVPTSDTQPVNDMQRIAVREAQAQRGCLMPEDAFKPDSAKLRVSRLRMNVGSAARLHLAAEERPGHRPDDCLMLTLTYRNGESGAVEWSPRHISDCLKRIRQWMKRRGWPCRYVWVSELGEKSGRLHYHVALWVPHGKTIPHADATGWWPHGMTRTETARHAVGYLMSYLTKGSKEGELGEYPKHARIYGVGGLDVAARRCRAWLNRPAFMQSRFDVRADVARAPGGGWVDRDSGQWWPSEFKASFPGGELVLHRVHDHGRSPLVGGPYSYLNGAAPFVH